MKMLIDGEEDDVVGYQPEGSEGYAELVMIAKRATNQSAFRDRCGWCCWAAVRNSGVVSAGCRTMFVFGSCFIHRQAFTIILLLVTISILVAK